MLMFCSRDSRYRSPFGAVAAHTPVHFRLCLPRSLGCRGAFLVRRADSGLPQYDGMFWAGMEGDDREWWECHFAPDAADLYWYAFALETDGGRRYLCRTRGGQARLSDTLDEWWQLTCYEDTFATPDWLAGGVMYQIFPDRFCKSEKKKANVPSDRVLRDVWGEQPHWQPDAAGVVRNNDFFGGDLAGITEKLGYLQRLGVTCLYLNPIFESHSNHRYDTADYSRIDPMLGTADDLKTLTEEAKRRGIRVMLDGVFSHTGADSIYFNKYGRYGEGGAFRDPASPYAAWYHFSRWPDGYAGWWGFETLPEVEELNPAFLEYITGDGGILHQWMACGVSAWRLDVADELPDGFLEALRTSVKQVDPEGMMLGEVWEDASNKHSYGHRRRYLLGRQLDSVMNYPFRGAILDYLRGGRADDFVECVMTVLENYPPQVVRLLMNSLGTHDTERAITLLGGEPLGGRGRRWQSEQRLSPEQYERGKRLLMLGGVLQYALPGVPCLYYGDEAGLQGYRDPFNRGCYPWGREDAELVAWFERLGQCRRECDVFAEGAFWPLYADGAVVFTRGDEESGVLCAVNPTNEARAIPLPDAWCNGEKMLGSGTVSNGLLHLPPLSSYLQKTPAKKV